VYGFDAQGFVIKQQSRLSVSTRASSVNNYDAQKMAARLNESVYKDAEEARAEEIHKKIEKEVMAKLSTQFSSEWA